MKVAINKCFGGFGLSLEAFEWLIKNKGWKVTSYCKNGNGYDDPNADLVDHRTAPEANKYPSLYSKLKYYPIKSYYREEFRTNPDVIEVIEKLGEKANGDCASLAIVDIPEDINWEIDEYDGIESVREISRSWG